MTTKYINIPFEIYVDLDGTLYDFDKKALAMGFDRARMETEKSEFWKTVARQARTGIEMWGDLELLPDALELWNFVKPYRPYILTATGHVGNALPEKAKRIHIDLGNIPTIFVRKSVDKARFAGPNRILIDDREKSIGPWIEKGGIGILHTSASDSIKQLQEILKI